MSVAGVLMLLVSAALMGGTALLTAAVLVRPRADRFWVFVGAISAQLGTVAVLTSLLGAYSPWPYLAAQAVIFGAAVVAYRRWGGCCCRGEAARPSWTVGARAMLLCAAALVLISLLEQAVTPVHGFDERMYNCSRAVYWMQHRSILPFATHNEAHVDMPIGAELYFGWAVMLTHAEVWGRLAIWLGFPVAVIGAYLVARRIGAGRTGAAAAALIFAASPTVLHIAGNAQKQDMWNAAFSLGVGYWVARAARARSLMPFFLSGFFLLLAINAKTTSLTLLPFVCGVVVLARRGGGFFGRAGAAAAGMVGGLLLSGLIVVVASNVSQYGSPLGSPGLKAIAQPDMSLHQIWTHTVRVPAFLMELPEHPIEASRQGLGAARAGLLERMGVDGMLDKESTTGWPGYFETQAPQYARNYSLGGMLWLVMLLPAAPWALWRLRRKWPRLNPAPLVWVMAMSGAYLVGLVYLLRWVNGTWDRYWLGAYALGIAGASTMAWICLRRRPWAAAAAGLLIAAMVYPSMRMQIARVDKSVRTLAGPEVLDEPFEEVVPHLGPGSKVLLVCSRAARDYPLFLPRQGYSCEVYPWGPVQFDRERMASMIEKEGITHVLFEREDVVGFHWRRGVPTKEMISWVGARGDFVQIPLQTPKMRLFRKGTVPDTVQIGPFFGFAAVDGMAPVEGPYPESGLPRVCWGTGTKSRLSLVNASGPMVLHLECRRNNTLDQALTVRINGKQVARHEFKGPLGFDTLEIEFEAREGANEAEFEYVNTEGDRQLSVLFRRIQVLPRAGR